MKSRLFSIRHFVFIFCFIIAFPFHTFAVAASTPAINVLTREPTANAAKQRRRSSGKTKAGAQKSRSGKSASRGTSKGRRGRRSNAAPAGAPRTSFDKVMSENRALLSEANDADQAGTRIEENTLRAHVRYLSDDLLEGRGPGARGGMLAAKYIASQFEALGLEPAGAEHSYFQLVQMIGSRPDPANRLVVKTGSGSSEFKFADEFVGGTDMEQTEVPINGYIVFVGYGITAPEANWDDYKGQDVRGKILMMMVNDPPATATEPNLFGGKALTYYGRWTYKYEEAARRGAAGVILIHTNQSAGYGWNVVRNSWGAERFGLVPDANAPTLKLKSWVTEDVARRIAMMGGQNLDQLLQQAAARSFKPVTLDASVDTTMRYLVQRMTSPNVAGIYRGNDPTLKNEYVTYSAHWDHLGIRPDQPGDNIYNGAVDNATGVAGILAIAKAFGALNIKPKRSILFIATTAEEQGLLGAEYYAQHPLVPLKDTVANINIDSMNVLGQTTDLTPLGADRSTLGKVIEEVAKENGLTVSPDAHPEQGSFYRSDHFPVAKAGVPAVNFEPGSKFVGHSEKWGEEQFNDYNEHHYHQPSDEYNLNWNVAGMIQQARMAFLVGLRVANWNEVPHWNKGDEFERARLKSLGKAQ
jgi:Zn-dependent M28 family amino/carboxypeptidase